MGWLNKTAAGDAVKALEGTLKQVDSMTTSAEERSDLRRRVFEAALESHQAVVEAELSSGNWLSRSWRPVLMLGFGGCGMVNMMAISLGLDVAPLPDTVWEMIVWTVGPLAAFRSGDKIIPKFSPRQIRKLKKAGVDIEA